jgi:hypothetical protein
MIKNLNIALSESTPAIADKATYTHITSLLKHWKWHSPKRCSMLHTNGAKQIRDVINEINNAQPKKVSELLSVIIISFLNFSPKIIKKADTSKDTSPFLTLINYSSFYLLHLLSTPSPYS